jgi:hypothetical protein
MESLANHPAEDFLTDEETETALKILRENKWIFYLIQISWFI